MSAKRLTPNSIANLVMADEAWHDSQYVAAAEYDRLTAELEALRADAERYRWLRSAVDNDSLYVKNHPNKPRSLVGFQALDAAIDAARASHD